MKESAPFLVSAAALLVSYNSYLISQNQLLVSTKSVEPHFYVSEVPLYDEKTKTWFERELKVFNIAAPVANVSTSVKSYYKVNDYGEIGEKWIPLIGYYYASFATGEPTGLLTTFKGMNNATKDFNATFVAYRDSNSKYYNIEIEHIVYINYQAFDGVIRKVCFRNQILVECNTVNDYLVSEYSPLELNDLTYKQLISKYEEMRI